MSIIHVHSHIGIARTAMEICIVHAQASMKLDLSKMRDSKGAKELVRRKNLEEHRLEFQCAKQTNTFHIQIQSTSISQ